MLHYVYLEETNYIQTTRYEVIWSHNDHFITALGKNGKKGQSVESTLNINKLELKLKCQNPSTLTLFHPQIGE